MRLLLDTHALLWFLADDPQLNATAKAAIGDPANERWLSAISLLEIALKNRLGKLLLPTRGSANRFYRNFDQPSSLVFFSRSM